MTKIMKSGSKCLIILPKKLTDGMSWQVGDRLQVIVAGKDKLQLVKVNLSAQQAKTEEGNQPAEAVEQNQHAATV